jgi:hypothetical protein
MKSQAVAFLLGFTLTSFLLLFVPGIYKNTSKTGNGGDHRLASVTRATGDSTTVTTDHFSNSPAIANH